MYMYMYIYVCPYPSNDILFPPFFFPWRSLIRPLFCLILLVCSPIDAQAQVALKQQAFRWVVAHLNAYLSLPEPVLKKKEEKQVWVPPRSVANLMSCFLFFFSVLASDNTG